MMKRMRTMHGVVAAAILATAPAIAAAQDTGQGQQDQPQQGQGQQQGQPQQKGQQKGQTQQGQAQQPGETSEKFTKKTTISEHFSAAVANGCQYTADVSGTVTPAKPGGTQKGGAQQSGAQQQQSGAQQSGAQQAVQHLDPNLTVTASLTCPGGQKREITDTISRTGPLTREALEDAIERRATIVAIDTPQQCAYMPDFQIAGQKLSAVGVAYLCATPVGRGQQQGSLGPGSHGSP